MTRREPELKAFLAHLPLLQGLSPAEIARVAAGTTRRRLRAGETLRKYRPDDVEAGRAYTAAYVEFVRSGSTKRRRAPRRRPRAGTPTEPVSSPRRG